jgi:hypothetical protein
VNPLTRVRSATSGRERAVSTPLGYILTLAITTVLVSGLLIAMGGFVDGQRERVVRSELEVVGEQVAADVSAADRLVVAGGADTTVRAAFRLPARVGGSQYTVDVVADGGAYAVRLASVDPDVTVEVGFDSETSVRTSTPVAGGNVVVVYADGPDGDTDPDRLEVRSDD